MRPQEPPRRDARTTGAPAGSTELTAGNCYAARRYRIMATLNLRKITFFWALLAATWPMMALEGLFLAAVIARLADPGNNPAYGVAFRSP